MVTWAGYASTTFASMVPQERVISPPFEQHKRLEIDVTMVFRMMDVAKPNTSISILSLRWPIPKDERLQSTRYE